MATARLTDKTELTSTPDAADVLHIVDVSDMSGSPEGTSKKITYDRLLGNTPFFFDLTTPPSSVVILNSLESGNAFAFQYSATLEQFSFANNNPGGGATYNMSFLTDMTIGGITKLAAAPPTPFLAVTAPSVLFFSENGMIDTQLNNSANNSFLKLVFTAINTITDQRLYVEGQVLKTSTGRTIWGWYKQS